jgi:hypothetical protein
MWRLLIRMLALLGFGLWFGSQLLWNRQTSGAAEASFGLRDVSRAIQINHSRR